MDRSASFVFFRDQIDLLGIKFGKKCDKEQLQVYFCA